MTSLDAVCAIFGLHRCKGVATNSDLPYTLLCRWLLLTTHGK